MDEKVREHCARLGLSLEPNFDPFEYVKQSMLRRRAGDERGGRGQGREEARGQAQALSLGRLTLEDASNPRIVQTIYHFADRPILLDPDNQAINWI